MSYVLVVDDEAAIRNLLVRFLSMCGYRTREAETAEAALAHVEQEPPDVAVCDVHMPGANGLWLADRLRAVSPCTAIVLATGDTQVPPVESLRKGVVAYELKPLDPVSLEQSVRTGIAWSAAERRRGRRTAPAGLLAGPALPVAGAR